MAATRSFGAASVSFITTSTSSVTPSVPVRVLSIQTRTSPKSGLISQRSMKEGFSIPGSAYPATDPSQGLFSFSGSPPWVSENLYIRIGELHMGILTSLYVSPLAHHSSQFASMFENLFASLSFCGVELSSVFPIADHFVAVGCALTAIFSDPDTPPDAPPQPLTASQYRRSIQYICPGRRFEDVDTELTDMHKILDAEFAEGLRQAASAVREYRRRLRIVIADWNPMDPDTRGPEPPAIDVARDGVAIATSILHRIDSGLNVADCTACGKLSLLVIEKMGQMDLLECSKANRDATFKATTIVLRHYNVV
ncbi:hypothetical protein FRC10_004367 [Ceratobasidium sp. 414]|nr:hypothetical protein FRC10_004367 [Ceratobasidium sp. 414]